MVSKYAEPYHPTSLTELNSDVMAGVAMATIDRSWLRISAAVLHTDPMASSAAQSYAQVRTNPAQMHDSMRPAVTVYSLQPSRYGDDN